MGRVPTWTDCWIGRSLERRRVLLFMLQGTRTNGKKIQFIRELYGVYSTVCSYYGELMDVEIFSFAWWVIAQAMDDKLCIPSGVPSEKTTEDDAQPLNVFWLPDDDNVFLLTDGDGDHGIFFSIIEVLDKQLSWTWLSCLSFHPSPSSCFISIEKNVRNNNVLRRSSPRAMKVVFTRFTIPVSLSSSGLAVKSLCKR